MILFQKITLFSLLCPLVAAASIGYAIYYHWNDASGIATGYMIVLLLIVILLFVLDRLAARYIPPGWLSVGEGLLLAVSVLSYAYTTRTTTLDFSANRSPYIVLIWVKNPALSTSLERTALFSKTLAVPDVQTIRLDQAEFGRLVVKPPATWTNSYFSTGIDLNDSRFVSAYIYAPEEYQSYTKEEISNLIHKAVDQQTP